LNYDLWLEDNGVVTWPLTLGPCFNNT